MCLGGGGTVLWWLVRWSEDLKVGGWRPGSYHSVVSLDKKALTSHCPALHPMYLWVLGVEQQ